MWSGLGWYVLLFLGHSLTGAGADSRRIVPFLAIVAAFGNFRGVGSVVIDDPLL